MTEIQTARLLLRPFRASDTGRIVEFASDPEYRRYLGPDHPVPEQFVAINLTADRTREPGWVICVADEVVGSIFIGLDAPEPGGLACLVAREAWGKGIATEATTAIIDFAFAECRLDEVFAWADEENARSVRVLERLGLVKQRTEGGRSRYVMTRHAWRLARGDAVESAHAPDAAQTQLDP